MYRQQIISLKNVNAINKGLQMSNAINLEIWADEQIAIIGPNGSGKSLLTNILLGSQPRSGHIQYDFGKNTTPHLSKNIQLITFKDVYGSAYTPAYYQQRWNKGDQDSYPTVSEILGITQTENSKNKIYNALHIYELQDKRIIELSSGELRRFQLAQVLKKEPKILILDNPLIGLDKTSRETTLQVLETLCHEIQLIIVVSRIQDIPSFVTHVIEVKEKTVYPKATYTEFLESQRTPSPRTDNIILSQPECSYIPKPNNEHNIVTLNHISIKYGKHIILNNINWQINSGEHWALTGANGTGKSTLLSLIYADNPQAYACDITLFGKKRGTGESIWDIKKRIGYLSPEMYRCFNKNIPAKAVIANSLLNTVGFFKKPSSAQIEQSLAWMRILNIEDLAERMYPTLSSGEQRLVLLARAFVKNPELLILDEPFHGLDDQNTSRIRSIINDYCKESNCSLIIVSHYTEDYPSCIDHVFHLQKQYAHDN